MNSEVVTVELEFIKLKKQIQMEKQSCNNLELQLEKNRNNSAHGEENNKAKTSHKTTLTFVFHDAEKNAVCKQTSLDIINGLERELEKKEKLKGCESTRKQLMEKLWNFEKRWETLKNMYHKLPFANEVHALEIFNKQLALQLKFKRQAVIDTEFSTATYKNITDKYIKSRTVKLAHCSMKSKEISKQKLSKTDNLRSLIESDNKMKNEKSSLIGKVKKSIPPYVLYGRPKPIDGFVAPPCYGTQGKKQKINNTCMYQKSSMMLHPEIPTVKRIQTPELMIIKTTPFKYASQVAVQEVTEALPATDDPSTCKIIDEKFIASAIKRRKEDSSSPTLNIHHYVNRDQATIIAKTGNILAKQTSSTCTNLNIDHINSGLHYSSSKINEGKHLPNEHAEKEKHTSDKTHGPIQPPKHLINILQESAPRRHSTLNSKTVVQQHTVHGVDSSSSSLDHKCKDATFKFGPNGIPSMLEDKKHEAILKAVTANFNAPPKSANVWDILN